MKSPNLEVPARAFVFAAALVVLSACSGRAADDTAAVAAVDSAAMPAASVTLAAGDLTEATSGDITGALLLTGVLEPGSTGAVTAQPAGSPSSALTAAEAELVTARNRRDAAERALTAGTISRVDAEGARAVFAAAEAQVAAARSRLPAPDARVVSTSWLELAGRVPADAAANITAGQQVRFTIDALPNEEFIGTVNRKDPVSDPANGQVGVRIRLPNQNGRITAGQFARGEVSGSTMRNAVRIPETAVVGNGAESHVFVVVGTQLVRRAVVVAVRDVRSGLVAVTQGVAVGDRVVVRPASGLLDTQPVTITGM